MDSLAELSYLRKYKVPNYVGRCGGLAVSVLAFYSDDPSSIPELAS